MSTATRNHFNSHADDLGVRVDTLGEPPLPAKKKFDRDTDGHFFMSNPDRPVISFACKQAAMKEAFMECIDDRERRVMASGKTATKNNVDPHAPRERRQQTTKGATPTDGNGSNGEHVSTSNRKGSKEAAPDTGSETKAENGTSRLRREMKEALNRWNGSSSGL